MFRREYDRDRRKGCKESRETREKDTRKSRDKREGRREEEVGRVNRGRVGDHESKCQCGGSFGRH